MFPPLCLRLFVWPLICTKQGRIKLVSMAFHAWIAIKVVSSFRYTAEDWIELMWPCDYATSTSTFHISQLWLWFLIVFHIIYEQEYCYKLNPRSLPLYAPHPFSPQCNIYHSVSKLSIHPCISPPLLYPLLSSLSPVFLPSGFAISDLAAVQFLPSSVAAVTARSCHSSFSSSSSISHHAVCPSLAPPAPSTHPFFVNSQLSEARCMLCSVGARWRGVLIFSPFQSRLFNQLSYFFPFQSLLLYFRLFLLTLIPPSLAVSALSALCCSGQLHLWLATPSCSIISKVDH